MILERIKDFFFPKKCALCRRVLSRAEEESGRGLCGECDLSFYRIPWKEPAPQVAACFRYENRMRRAITDLKYEGRKSYAPFFAAWMLEEGAVREYVASFDIITSVPVSEKRLFVRGYNQAELIARALGDALGVPYEETLKRAKETLPLKGLDKVARKKTLENAFAALPREGEEEGLRILIIDDILTTGSTLEGCIETLSGTFPAADIRALAFASENEDFA